MNHAKRLTLGRGVAVSLAVHACVILAIAIWAQHAPRVSYRSTNRLNVEVAGVVAKRQTAAQQQRIEAPLPKPAEPKHESNDRKPVVTPRAQAPTELHIPQLVPTTDALAAIQLPQGTSTQHEDSNASAARPQAGADTQQPQQTIAVHNDMSDRIAAYMAQLTKQLQSNLIYPPDAKKKKIEGTSLVTFVITESGEIQSNTLVVKRSSGNATLDASALRTVASSAPFQKPPRELNVSIELEFEVDSKIF